MTDYEDYRRVQIEDGLMFQDFVVDIAWQAGIVISQYASKAYQYHVGESRNGIEIKHDKKRKETGNICLEVSEKARPREGDYVPSGIMRGDSWIYAIGDYDIVYLFPTKFLRSLYNLKTSYGQPKYRRYSTPTSQGFLLPEADGEKYSALILHPNAENKVTSHAGDLESLAKELHIAAFESKDQLKLFN